MTKNKKQEAHNIKTTKKLNIKISNIDIDKAEYKEIVLSNSNFPDEALKSTNNMYY